MDDIVQFLRDCLDEDEQTACAAAPGPWRADGGSVYVGHPINEIVDYSESAEHIARHDPVRVLAEVDAKRQLLSDILKQSHDWNEEDHWYSCSALRDETGELLCTNDARAGAPCDCGRDQTVERRVRLLALPYAGHPAYREDWRPTST
ncbi:DUF6221 family protein [Streptomyces subrutilus]|uniref:DUF6221 family protein n=1 Tax=Streptomyces subrutilus TaxID=36818 RepID=UPI002E119A51|nr:DUF6221 family protein [Streptomyces subrutilus]